MTSLTVKAVEAIEDASTRDAGRAKNLFALGVLSWLYGRPTEVTERWIEQKFARKPAVMQANLAAFNAGWSFGETTELLDVQYRVKPATDTAPGTYRNVNGTTALALGLLAASVKSRLPLVLASYPITPASELLHELSRHARLGVSTVQAEDEIAAAGMALGAAFGGRLGVTATSGPGMDLKAETIGLAVMLELPMIVIDVQRAGPSTGMPTKTEQSDLLMALYGRHGESPLPVIAAEHARRVLRRRIRGGVDRDPLPHAGDPALRHASWRPPRSHGGSPRSPTWRRSTRRSPRRRPTGEPFLPYGRDERLARPWALPGTAGLQHRIGGIEKADGTGNISYDGVNHERMTELRAAKVAGIADELPPLRVDSEARRPAAGPRLGIERGRDPRRRPPRPRGRPQGRLRAPAPSQPAAGEPRRRAALIRPRARPGDEQRPAGPGAAGPIPRRRRVVHQGPGPAPVRRARSSSRSRSGIERRRGAEWSAVPSAHQGRLPVRPGDALVPGMRRLRRPLGGAGVHARARDPARADRVHHRHRLRRPVRLLHGHLRHARDPRPRAGARHRAGHRARRPVDLGRHRRRRRAVDRRQPPDPRAAAQRPGEDPAVQQPDLRPDQGPGVADLGARQDHQVDAVRRRRPSVQPARAGARRRRDVRRADDRS